MLAHAGPTKLAAALATDLMNRPADDPLRTSPQMAGLRGLLDAPAVTVTAAVRADEKRRRRLAVAADLFSFVSSHHRARLASACKPDACDRAGGARGAAGRQKQVFAVALGKFDDAAIAASVWSELLPPIRWR
ncbi:MAG: hypothetical protein WDN76_06605 [Alphaproteobacteria bacterium]